jgi:hypothetical protein
MSTIARGGGRDPNLETDGRRCLLDSTGLLSFFLSLSLSLLYYYYYYYSNNNKRIGKGEYR